MKYDVSFSADLRRNPYKGLYIALEGIDGAGKTVQLERIKHIFSEQKKDFTIVTEPRRTGVIGKVINEFLQKRVKLPPASIQYLICADRIAYQAEVILPALKRGEAVISHRCFWSAVPYGIMDRSNGGYKVDVGNMLIVAQSILSMYYQIVIPDITFYLNISAETALVRLNKMGVAKEYYETHEKLISVKKGYEWMIERFPNEFTVIDGERGVDEVTEDMLKVISKLK